MNKIKHLKVLITSVIVSLVACKKESEQLTVEKDIQSNIEIDSFEYKLKNNPKFFLKFWDKMTEEEYSKVKTVLQKDGKIDGFGKYIAGKESIEFEPIKDDNNGKIIGIELFDFSENFYNLLKDKYNLDPLITENKVVKSYIEENPCFLKLDCSEKLSRGKFIKNINEDELYNQLGTNFERFNTKVLKEYTEIITKTSNIIISQNNNKSYKYQLDLDIDYEPKDTYFYYFEPKREDSQKRVVVRVSDNIIYAKYFSANYFEREKKEKEERYNESKKQEQILKDNINQVKNDL